MYLPPHGVPQLPIVVLLTLALGCGNNPAAPPVVANPAAKTPATAPAIGAPSVLNADAHAEVSDEECLTFAKQLEEAVMADDGHSAGDLFIWSQMVDRALQGLSSPENPNEFIEGIRAAGSHSKAQLPNTLGAQVKQGGSYKFLRIRSGPEGKRLLFRLLGTNGGVNYHEIMLGHQEGKVVGTDIYIYMSGETMPETIRRMAILGATKGDSDLGKRLRATEKGFSTYTLDSMAMISALQEQRFEDCLTAYKRLSPTAQKEKAFMLLRVLAAQKINEKEQVAAIDAFRKTFPTDACVDLIAIDSFFLKQDFAGARECIERVDKAVGGDPYLHVLRANSYLNEAKFDDADREARVALDGDASLTSALWVLVSISLNKREFADTAKLLGKLEREHRLDLTNLAMDAAYAEFVKSPEYEKWQSEKSSTR